MLNRYGLLMGVLGLPILLCVSECKAETDNVIVIKEHRFQPQELTIPAGKKVKLIIDNQDATPEEFESYELHREKIIPGHSKGVVFVGPLKPGRYPFFGEFNQKTAQGAIIASESVS